MLRNFSYFFSEGLLSTFFEEKQSSSREKIFSDDELSRWTVERASRLFLINDQLSGLFRTFFRVTSKHNLLPSLARTRRPPTQNSLMVMIINGVMETEFLALRRRITFLIKLISIIYDVVRSEISML